MIDDYDKSVMWPRNVTQNCVVINLLPFSEEDMICENRKVETLHLVNPRMILTRN